MTLQIGKWGNSLAVRIPGAYAKELELAEGVELEMTRVGGGLMLTPKAHEYRLAELLAQIKPEQLHGETEWGAPPAARRGKPIDAPDAGDLVWLSFTPHAGREQSGRRPGLVLSPRSYNAKVGLCLVCPITSQVKGFAFEVVLPAALPVQGVVLADHVKSADWRERRCDHIATVPDDTLAEVRGKLKALVGG